LIKFFGHPIYEVGGSILIILSIVLFTVGVRRYLMTKKLISNIDPEDWMKVEGVIKIFMATQIRSGYPIKNIIAGIPCSCQPP
jgi:uncharacterized membrane protein YidH (DUF202 family)